MTVKIHSLEDVHLMNLFLVDEVTLLYNCGFRIVVLTNKIDKIANSNMMQEKLY